MAHWLAKAESGKFIASSEKNCENTAENSKESAIAAVDFATLDEITDNDAEMKREVVELYLAQTVGNLCDIERAISVNDSQALYEIAHKTVGGSALCGMTAIVAPMRKLEQLGRDGKVKEAFPFFTQAQNAFAAIDRECRENIPGM